MITTLARDRVVERLESVFPDADTQPLHDNDPAEVAELIDEYKSRGGRRTPRLFVTTGDVTRPQRNTDNRMPEKEFDVEVWIITRSAHSRERRQQAELAEKWSMLVEAALSGWKLDLDPDILWAKPTTFEDFTDEQIANSEDVGIALVTSRLSFVVDLDTYLTEHGYSY